MKRSPILATLLALLLMCFAFGCDDDDDSNPACEAAKAILNSQNCQDEADAAAGDLKDCIIITCAGDLTCIENNCLDNFGMAIPTCIPALAVLVGDDESDGLCGAACTACGDAFMDTCMMSDPNTAGEACIDQITTCLNSNC